MIFVSRLSYRKLLSICNTQNKFKSVRNSTQPANGLISKLPSSADGKNLPEVLRINFPFSITPLDPEINAQLLQDFTGERDGFVQVGPKKYLLPSIFAEQADNFYNFQARSDDVWIMTFPRSGTTMTMELVWMFMHNFDFERGLEKTIIERVPMFDFSLLANETFTEEHIRTLPADEPALHDAIRGMCVPQYERLGAMVSPRVIKTHFPFSLAPPSVMEKKAKVIYVARNPKDVAVSWYHLCSYMKFLGFRGDFAQFWDYFERDLTYYAPYWQHVKEGWSHRHEPNVLFLFYEDIVQDMSASIWKIAKFLYKEVTDDNVKRLADHMNIDNFRRNPSTNHKHLEKIKLLNPVDSSFIRKGKVSKQEWPAEYTPELIERAKNWMEENLQDTTLRFPE